MTLTGMLLTDRDALECDLMEFYHIEDMHKLPLKRAALFASGLRDNSRIKVKLAGLKVPLETILFSKMSDDLGYILWSKTKSGMKNTNKPKSFTRFLLADSQEKEKDFNTYDTPEEFMEIRNRIVEGYREEEK